MARVSVVSYDFYFVKPSNLNIDRCATNVGGESLAISADVEQTDCDSVMHAVFEEIVSQYPWKTFPTIL